MFTFLRALVKPNLEEAMHALRQVNPLANVTARLCKDPYMETRVFNKNGERISIRMLEQFVTEHVREKHRPPGRFQSKIKVAVIGSGPAGLMAAFTLSELGYAVTIYDSLPEPGGCLRWAYGRYRLPLDAVARDIEFVKGLGVRFKMNCMFGKSFGLDDLKKHGYKATVIATGATAAKRLNMLQENAAGVMSSEDFLLRLNLMNADQYPKSSTMLNVGRRVVVIGGGNAAFDCARSALRLGRQVTLVVNGTEDDMNVREFIIRHAREEGVKFELLTQCKEVLTDAHGIVRGLRCVRMDYGDPDKTGDWQLFEVAESDFDMEVDTIIVAVGHQPNPAFKFWDERIKLSKSGRIKTDAQGQTAVEGVFACGNGVTGPGPVFEAMVHAKNVAASVHQSLTP